MFFQFFMFLVGVLCEIFFIFGYYDLQAPKNNVDGPEMQPVQPPVEIEVIYLINPEKND